MAAPKGNLYALKNGTRISRLVLGTLPFHRQLANVRKYRDYLELLTLEKHQEVNEEHAHMIDEACRWEAHATVCRSLMRERFKDMTTSEVMQCSKEIANATTKRNAAVRLLCLARDTQANVIDALYGPEAESESA